MPTTITYKDLFKVTILHSYFLNSGNVDHEDLDTALKKKLANQYSFDQFITITPTIETATLLKNNKLITQSNGDTMNVGVRVNSKNPKVPFTGISLDLTLNFIIRINDFLFENYTDIELTKDQLFYFSNEMPPLPNPGFKNIALLNGSTTIDDAFKVNEDTTKAILKTLEESEKREIFGILSMKMNSTNSDLNILNQDKTIKALTPHFKIHFNNRKTIWKYVKTNTSFYVFTKTTKPLVKNGFIEILQADLDLSVLKNEEKTLAAKLQYPNPSVKSTKKAKDKTYYSEIFI